MPLSNTPSHNPLKLRAGKRGIAAGSSLTRRVTIAWHERPARESMGETPMPLSNSPSHNPFKQRAGKRGIAVNASLTRRVTKLPPKVVYPEIHSLFSKRRGIYAFAEQRAEIFCLSRLLATLLTDETIELFPPGLR